MPGPTAQVNSRWSITPKGVNCALVELLDDSCEAELRSDIADTGGSYEVNAES